MYTPKLEHQQSKTRRAGSFCGPLCLDFSAKFCGNIVFIRGSSLSAM